MENHNVVTVEIGGTEYEFSFTLWAMILAEEKGIDFSDAPIDEDEAEEAKGNLKLMLKLLTVARLPYDEETTMKSLGMSIGMADMPAIVDAYTKVFKRQFTEDVRAELESRRSGKATGE